ncbi:MAG: hypothetical protein HZB30_00350 [Nitrospirae bacterium]|nr:hypothetical protein [Nitrospirota bacterium]
MKNEHNTRKEIIDKKLQTAGWNVADSLQVIEEFDIEVALPEGINEAQTPYQGHQFSDYVLLGKDGKSLAVVEAKKTSVDAAIGREQAKQYCLNIQKKSGGELPFCFYTNGHDIFFWAVLCCRGTSGNRCKKQKRELDRDKYSGEYPRGTGILGDNHGV